MSQTVPTHFHKAWYVRAAAFRIRVFNFENAISIGFRSGEYGGRKIRSLPWARSSARARLDLWDDRLSA